MPVRVLSSELQKKAEDELNEVSSRTREDVRQIQEWIYKQHHLNVRLEEQWLLSFLRGCKFSLEKTKQKLDCFYTLRTLVPEFFADRDPLLPEIQDILKNGWFWVPLPKSKDPAAPRVLYLGNGLYDPDKVQASTLMKVNLMIFDILVNEDDNFVIAGHYNFLDLKGMSVNHVLQITPAFIKKCAICFGDGYPSRPKGIHFTNLPGIFETLSKSFRTGKYEERISINSENYYGKLHTFTSKSLLPKEFGGENGTFNDILVEWKKKVESYREWFLDDAKYCSDESRRPGKAKISSELFGMEGSFRKLDID